MAKNPTRIITTTSGMDGETEVTVIVPTPSARTGPDQGEPGGPGAPGYVFRDDAGFLEKARAAPENLEQILSDHLFKFRAVTDGVNWQQVAEEETRLRTLLEAK